MNTESQDLKIAAQLLSEHAQLCSQNLGGTPDSLYKMKEVKEILERYGYEFCSHNAAILGSSRYKKYKENEIDTLLTFSQYEKIQKGLNERKESSLL